MDANLIYEIVENDFTRNRFWLVQGAYIFCANDTTAAINTSAELTNIGYYST